VSILVCGVWQDRFRITGAILVQLGEDGLAYYLGATPEAIGKPLELNERGEIVVPGMRAPLVPTPGQMTDEVRGALQRTRLAPI
jgi:hypothetical protein